MRKRRIRRSGKCAVCQCEISLALRNSYFNKYGSIGRKCKGCSSSSAAENRAKKYGLTEESYLLLFQAQLGRCAICYKPHQDVIGHRLCVDHDHATGAVRGLLCRKCNSGIGLLGDSAETLRRAAYYLDENRGISGY